MPWHKVVIIHNDQARWSAAALMRPFIMGFSTGHFYNPFSAK